MTDLNYSVVSKKKKKTRVRMAATLFLVEMVTCTALILMTTVIDTAAVVPAATLAPLGEHIAPGSQCLLSKPVSGKNYLIRNWRSEKIKSVKIN